jgi:hypothetical protein
MGNYGRDREERLAGRWQAGHGRVPRQTQLPLRRYRPDARREALDSQQVWDIDPANHDTQSKNSTNWLMLLGFFVP